MFPARAKINPQAGVLAAGGGGTLLARLGGFSFPGATATSTGTIAATATVFLQLLSGWGGM